MEQDLSNALLLDKLRELHQSVEGVRTAVVDNTTAITKLEARVNSTEVSVREVRRAARVSAMKWASGIATALAGVIEAVVHYYTGGGKTPGH